MPQFDGNNDDYGMDVLLANNESDEALRRSQDLLTKASLASPVDLDDMGDDDNDGDDDDMSYGDEDEEDGDEDEEDRRLPTTTQGGNQPAAAAARPTTTDYHHHRTARTTTAASSIASSMISSKLHHEEPAAAAKPSFTREEVTNMKRELLYQVERLERKGVRMKKFTMQSSFDEIKAELDKVKRDRELDASVRFQRMFLSTCVTGIEYLNSKFDPFEVRLDGWSDSVNDNMNEYDDIFEELHLKYKSRAQVAPEIKLMFMLGGSAVKFHMTNTLFRSSLPNFDQVMKDNPNLMNMFTEAAMNAATNSAPQQQPRQQQSGGGGLFGMLGSMFGGAASQSSPQQQQRQHFHAQAPPPSSPQRSMRGPSNVEDILRDFENGNNVDMVSTMSDTDSIVSAAPPHAGAADKLNKHKNNAKAAAAKPVKTRVVAAAAPVKGHTIEI